MMAISSLQNLVAQVPAPASPVPASPVSPEPVHMPAPIVVEPEPQPEHVPAPEPLRVDMPETPAKSAREPMWIFEEDEKHVEAIAEPPAPQPTSAHVPSPEPERAPQLVPEPESVPQTVNRKRSRDEMLDEEEMKEIGPIARVLSPRTARANDANMFGTFKRQTMSFEAVSNLVAPTKTPQLPPAIVMTRVQCEDKIRELEATFQVGLSRPEILSMRSAVATSRGFIKKLKMQIAEREAEATVGEQLEEVFQYCDTLRQLAASRAVKRAVLASFKGPQAIVV